jgi:hypothetical protein
MPILDPRLDARASGGVDVGQVPAEYEVEAMPGVASVGRQDAGRRGHGHPMVARLKQGFVVNSPWCKSGVASFDRLRMSGIG